MKFLDQVNLESGNYVYAVYSHVRQYNINCLSPPLKHKQFHEVIRV